MAMGQEMPVAALDSLEQLASQSPGCSVVQAGLGLQRFQQGDAVGAEAALRKGLAAAGADPEAASWIQGSLGILLTSQRRHAEGLPLLDAACAVRTQDVDLAVAAGVARAHVEGPSAGAKALDQTARQFPADPRPVMALATLLASNGDLRAAYIVLERANKTMEDPSLLLALAGSAKDVGEIEAAASALKLLSQMTGDPTWQRAADRLLLGN